MYQPACTRMIAATETRVQLVPRASRSVEPPSTLQARSRSRGSRSCCSARGGIGAAWFVGRRMRLAPNNTLAG